MQTSIVPVSVFPSTANVLYIRAGNLGPPPAYYYQLQSVTPIKGTPESGTMGEPDYVSATPDSEEVVVLKDGNVNMTEAQWAAWPAGLGPDGDSEYQLNAIAANLGLTRA
jgi:hypothetical protein